METKEKMYMYKLAYDLDGVIASTNVEEIESNLHRLIEHYAEQYPLLSDDFFEGNAVVITARDEKQKAMTEWWLKFFYPNTEFELYCVGYDEESAKRKVEVMKMKGIEMFIDDNDGWIEYMRSEGIKAIHLPIAAKAA